jgi:hypothetical protein
MFLECAEGKVNVVFYFASLLRFRRNDGELEGVRNSISLASTFIVDPKVWGRCLPRFCANRPDFVPFPSSSLQCGDQSPKDEPDWGRLVINQSNCVIDSQNYRVSVYNGPPLLGKFPLTPHFYHQIYHSPRG